MSEGGYRNLYLTLDRTTRSTGKYGLSNGFVFSPRSVGVALWEWRVWIASFALLVVIGFKAGSGQF